MQFDIDPLEHRRQIAADLGIPETDNAISFLLKPKLPLVIALGVLVIIVMAAVEFDDQMLGGTEEIHDIRADWSLTAEVVPSTGSSFSARHNMRSCGVVLARSFLATARRMDAETMNISLADRSPHPAR